MKGHKEKLKSGAEYDVVCAAYYYTYLRRSGVKHGIKKQMSRRMRHEEKQKLRGYYD